VLISTNLLLFAQRDERRRAEFEELKEKRVAFFTQAMKLTKDEAKVFWPLYDELQAKKFELNRELRRAMSEFRGNGRERERKVQTEKDYKDIVTLNNKFKVDEIKLDIEYTIKFSKVISYEKIFQYQQAEQQFARQMLNQRREGDSQRPR